MIVRILSVIGLTVSVSTGRRVQYESSYVPSANTKGNALQFSTVRFAFHGGRNSRLTYPSRVVSNNGSNFVQATASHNQDPRSLSGLRDFARKATLREPQRQLQPESVDDQPSLSHGRFTQIPASQETGGGRRLWNDALAHWRSADKGHMLFLFRFWLHAFVAVVFAIFATVTRLFRTTGEHQFESAHTGREPHASVCSDPVQSCPLHQHQIRHAVPLMKDGEDDLPIHSRRALDREILAISVPALVGLAIDPVASLVDTAMIGRFCGSADLAGAGVAIGIYNLISRTFNFLSSATTSSVAALAPADSKIGDFTLEMSRAAAAALAVANCVGLVLAVSLWFGGGFLLGRLGLPLTSTVRSAAVQYLAARAVSFPASLSLMALQGAFRGAKDTKTPLGSLMTANVLNVVLDPLLIVTLRQGVAGAAIATTLSQYVAAWVLWRRLVVACNRNDASSRNTFIGLPKPKLSEMVAIARQGSWLTLRTFSGSATLAFSSIMATGLGVVQGAAHQICFQLWLATSLLADAIAVAAQALTASAVARCDVSTTRYLIRRTMSVGAAIGAGTAALLWLGSRPLCALFSQDPIVLAATAVAWPFVVLTQPLNTWAFGVDGLLFGASDFRFCAFLMVTSAIPAVIAMLFASQLGLPAVWIGLALYMGMRGLLGSARIIGGRGPWQLLRKPQ